MSLEKQDVHAVPTVGTRKIDRRLASLQVNRRDLMSGFSARESAVRDSIFIAYSQSSSLGAPNHPSSLPSQSSTCAGSCVNRQPGPNTIRTAYRSLESPAPLKSAFETRRGRVRPAADVNVTQKHIQYVLYAAPRSKSPEIFT
jgi:hypothetical protein